MLDLYETEKDCFHFTRFIIFHSFPLLLVSFPLSAHDASMRNVNLNLKIKSEENILAACENKLKRL